MWIIDPKPSVRKALKDAVVTVQHCRSLNAIDQTQLEVLYNTYDTKKGRVDSADLAPLDAKKDVIKKQYPKTYGKEVLSYIRKDLMKDVERCPICSVLPVTDLDHFLNESQFGQLAVCRLNLVPTCGKCNKLKTDKTADDFVHAYYQQFPANVVFLKADCRIVRGYVIPVFYIDGSGLGDSTLARRLKSQIKAVHLKNRLRAASKEFMRTLFQGTRFTTDKALKAYLKKRVSDKTVEYGLNDWRTALIRGLIACPEFDMTVVQNYRRSTKRTRDGRV